ncbi:hypothetical protein GCM10010389_28450 [Streptomyces echinoruber]|uniref:Uncharacterized protein n=1 Tax=Streptomyces echinoruber TaxID=68898 RepID=A0A918R7E3_9ACTN|nr:hypothetical protein GCM10010389_28450 [Streptomyces echinoruber]
MIRPAPRTSLRGFGGRGAPDGAGSGHARTGIQTEFPYFGKGRAAAYWRPIFLQAAAYLAVQMSAVV